MIMYVFLSTPTKKEEMKGAVAGFREEDGTNETAHDK